MTELSQLLKPGLEEEKRVRLISELSDEDRTRILSELIKGKGKRSVKGCLGKLDQEYPDPDSNYLLHGILERGLTAEEVSTGLFLLRRLEEQIGDDPRIH